MNEQEQLMDNLLNVDLEIIDAVRTLHQENWDSQTLKQQVGIYFRFVMRWWKN